MLNKASSKPSSTLTFLIENQFQNFHETKLTLTNYLHTHSLQLTQVADLYICSEVMLCFANLKEKFQKAAGICRNSLIWPTEILEVLYMSHLFSLQRSCGQKIYSVLDIQDR